MNWTSRWAAAAPLALLLVGSGLQAQEAEFGAQGGIQIPLGDLGSTLGNNFGYNLGGHLSLYYGDGHELRTRVDYQSYGGAYDSSGHKTDVSALGLGADYVYYTEQRRKGLYLTMGLGYQWWSVSPGSTSSSVALAAGAGYRLNQQWSFEGRFTTGQFRSDSGQANALQAMAFFHF